MKKNIGVCFVLMLSVTSFAIEFSATDMGSGQLRINYTLTAGEVLRGMALKISITSGDAVIRSNTKVVMAPLPGDFKYVFIDYSFSNPVGYTLGSGYPVADPAIPGVLPIYTSNNFVVSFGILDDSGNQGGLTVDSFFDIFFDLTTECTIEMSEDSLRGGIVGDNIQSSNLPMTVTVPVSPCGLECLSCEAPFYDEWVAWGKPDCWCYRKQCRGDITGTSFLGKPVTTADLNIFKQAYNVTDAVLVAVPNGICADLNHAAFLGKRVTTADLNLFKQFYNVAEAGVPDCYSANYNFWAN